jgi:hypothetical protein
MSDFATAGGHWYLPDGTPYYTLIGANGKERAVTLRDARKVMARPSVTGIIRCAAAPQLEKWKRNQVLLSALTLPHREDESEQAWLERVEQDWQMQGRDAADRGTAIHAAIERHYRGEPTPDWWEWVKVARDTLEAATGPQGWSAERSFAGPDYGGKTDLHSLAWVIDAKTKDGELTDKNCTLWDEHSMQGAAYRHGLGIPQARVAILFVSRDVPQAKVVEIPEPDLEQGWAMFCGLLAYWQAKNRYRPLP